MAKALVLFEKFKTHKNKELILSMKCSRQLLLNSFKLKKDDFELEIKNQLYYSHTCNSSE